MSDAFSEIINHRATIVRSESGGPIRTIINGSSRHATGRYSSAKSGFAQPWESKVERSHFWRCEADPAISHYLAQPHRLEIPVGSQKLVYFPDAYVEFHDGRVEIREIKDVYEEERDPLYHDKINYAHDVYRGRGWSFVLLERVDIERQPGHRNARTIQADRHVKFTGFDLDRAFACIERDGYTAPFERVAEALGGELLGTAILHALIVHGHVGIDLDRRIDADAPVWVRVLGNGGVQ